MGAEERKEGEEREEKGETHTSPDKSTTLSPLATLRDCVKVLNATPEVQD